MLAVGKTEIEPLAISDWLPTPLSILRVSAPHVVQESVTGKPAAEVNGSTKNEEISGVPYNLSSLNEYNKDGLFILLNLLAIQSAERVRL